MPETTVEGVSGNQLTEEFCRDQFVAFDDRDRFNEVGGWEKMNEALRSPWVLVMSLWDDVRGLVPETCKARSDSWFEIALRQYALA